MQAALPTVIWRDVPVQHFATPKGEYAPDRLGQQCRPLQLAPPVLPGQQVTTQADMRLRSWLVSR